MNERIRMIRKDLKLTQSEFGVEIGATRPMIASYESGAVIPDKSIRLLICQKFNVNEAWLETGEGKPYREGLVPELVHALRSMPAVQAVLERLLPRLAAEDFAHINALIDKLISEECKKEEP